MTGVKIKKVPSFDENEVIFTKNIFFRSENNNTFHNIY